ncbi:hypothetical protein PAECIP111893_01150 [Paenibacillus plantiphilus]|uniref:Uncharacterized protein n=1 Tax=Paenibacillus plantiphilus TaxID=2905650 RepID=A0ABM9C0I0_9BACL|nr:hypothetical protein [Paenibacillus plantiphilus]CAH1198884.1 hypothetical protein PAECIP111893_01150 [Paenibacillus plantiphilus]
MSKFKCIRIAAVIGILILSGCSGTTSEPEIPAIGNSTSCKEPPEVLNWLGTNYSLKEASTSLEPGMKIGFVQCDDGRFALGDEGPQSFRVYSNGDPRTNNDLLFLGAWGRALYTKQGEK